MVCRLVHHKLVAWTAALLCLPLFLSIFLCSCIYFCISLPLSLPQTWIPRRLCCISQHVEVFFGLHTSCCSSLERKRPCNWPTEKATPHLCLQPWEDMKVSTSFLQGKHEGHVLMTVKICFRCTVCNFSCQRGHRYQGIMGAVVFIVKQLSWKIYLWWLFKSFVYVLFCHIGQLPS